MFASASAALWLGVAVGWSGPTFRVFYLFGAILNVPYLALGTVYLLARPARRRPVAARAHGPGRLRRRGHDGGARCKAPISGDRAAAGSEVFGALPRILAAVGSGGPRSSSRRRGAGPLWRVLQGQERSRGSGVAAHPKRLALGNVLIAVGTFVLGASGPLNGRLGDMDRVRRSRSPSASRSCSPASWSRRRHPRCGPDVTPARLSATRAAGPCPPALGQLVDEHDLRRALVAGERVGGSAR